MSLFETAYILLRFPNFTETFVAEEIRRVQRLGGKVQLYSLLPPKEGPTHAVSIELQSKVRYVPGLFAASLWWAQTYFLLKAPRKYVRLLRNLLGQPASHSSIILRRLVVFVKSIWLAKELEKSQVKIIHTHFAWLSGAAAMVVSQMLNLPYSITTHAFDIYSSRNDLFRLTTTNANRLVTISEFNKRAMLDLNKSLSAEKIDVIHCGIDLENFHIVGKKQENEVIQITSVGSLIEKKGHEFLIRACGALNAQGMSFQCVIVGAGALEPSLRALIGQLGLEDVVVLAGHQTQAWVKDRLSQTDVFVLACTVTDDGDRDGIPVSMMEALAMGVPVISTPVTGIPELIRHEETGLLVPERDVNCLAAAIKRLAQDAVLRETLARQGRIKVEKEYDIQKNASRLLDLFQQMIEQ